MDCQGMHEGDHKHAEDEREGEEQDPFPPYAGRETGIRSLEPLEGGEGQDQDQGDHECDDARDDVPSAKPVCQAHESAVGSRDDSQRRQYVSP